MSNLSLQVKGQQLWSRNFSFLLLGGLLSEFGYRLYEVIMSWYVVDLTGSSTILGTMFVFWAVPNMVFMLLGGTMADNLNKARIMFLSDMSRSLVLAALVVVAIIGWNDVWVLFMISLVFGVSNAMFVPSRDSLIPLIVEESDLQKANSYKELGSQFAVVVGPLLAGLMVKWVGGAYSFAAPAVVILLSALSVKRIKYAHQKTDNKLTFADVKSNLQKGFRVVREKNSLVLMFVALAVFNIGYFGPLMVGLPILANKGLNVGVNGFSFMQVAMAVGMIVGSLICSRLKINRVGVVIFLATVVSGLMFSTIGLSGQLWVVIVTLAVIGGMITTINILLFSTIQREIDSSMLGTAMGFLNFIVVGTDPLTFFIAGVAFDHLPVYLCFLLGGVLVVITGFVGLFSKSIRSIRAD